MALDGENGWHSPRKLYRNDVIHQGRQHALQNVLDALLKGQGRARTSGTGALKLHFDHFVLIGDKGNVASILGDGGLHKLLQNIDDTQFDVTQTFQWIQSGACRW